MTDIKTKIYNKYGIDIDKEDILKLYSIKDNELTEEEIEKCILSTRSKWEKSKNNGMNEKIVERAKERLQNASIYEQIIRDQSMRIELIDYYNRKSDDIDESRIEFAKDYFRIVSSSKKITIKDAEFFFEYYDSEKKNKKYIIKMLETEYKIKKTDKLNKDDKNTSSASSNEKVQEDSILVKNLFSKEIIVKIKQSLNKYNEIKIIPIFQRYFEDIDRSLYEFLNLESMETLDQHIKRIKDEAKKSFDLRQLKGDEFIPVVELFNILSDITKHREIKDNFEEYKLLIKYPNLTPYMFAFTEVKKDTLKNIETEAIRDYDFFDEKDFIKNYYKPMYEHFGIINNGIEKLLKDANKKTRSNFVLKFLYKNEKMSFGAHILYLFAYFPLFIAYLIFEIFKEVFGKFYKMVIPFTIFYVLFLNIFIPKFTRLNRFYYSVSWIYNRKLWIKHITYLYRGLFELQIKRGFSVFLFSLVIVALYVIIYVGSTVIVYRILRDIGKGLNKEVDWNGIERTFDNIFLTIRKDAAELFNEAKLLYYKKFILKLILNAVCIVLMFRAIQWLSG